MNKKWQITCPHCSQLTQYSSNRIWNKAKRQLASGEKKYCKACQSDYYLKHGSPNEGKVSPHRGANYDKDHCKGMKWAKEVKKRDKHCQFCESTESLHAHHIFPRSRMPQLRYNLENGITLCQPCHVQVHREQPLKAFKTLGGVSSIRSH